MKNCEKCIYFGGYTGYYRSGCKEYLCSSFPASKVQLIYIKQVCRNYKEKEMTVKEAYQVMQAAWVELYNIEVGDTVKVLRWFKSYELGFRYCNVSSYARKIGTVREVENNAIKVKFEKDGAYFPFFCLEFIKKAEPKIEIDVRINGKTAKLCDISEETLRNIRKGEN